MAIHSDIARAVGILSRFNAATNEAHMTAAKQVCRYLKGTTGLKLVYSTTQLCEVFGYSDVDWASSLDGRHSTTTTFYHIHYHYIRDNRDQRSHRYRYYKGNVFMVAGGAASWLSKRQATVSVSTAEAEYVHSLLSEGVDSFRVWEKHSQQLSFMKII